MSFSFATPNKVHVGVGIMMNMMQSPIIRLQFEDKSLTVALFCCLKNE